jgi:aminoglycoside phosphotransferase (APT) family kinase protein
MLSSADMENDLNEGMAWELLAEACDRAGLNADSARLLRVGSNAVFRLTSPVIVRISRRSEDITYVRRTVSVAKWLESVNYPAVRVIAVDQPIIVDRHAVTFWEAVSAEGDEWASVANVAELLRELHKLDAPDSLNLPAAAPFDKAETRISANTWLADENRAFLASKLAELQHRYSRLEWVLPTGVIHGDASVGNALIDWDGNPVFIDLDGFAIGHREWDLILTAIYYDSFGWHTKEEYDTFTRIYGYDIMKWPGYPTLKELNEFLMITWIIQKAGESPDIAAEASKRIDALRTGASRKDWQPL